MIIRLSKPAGGKLFKEITEFESIPIAGGDVSLVFSDSNIEAPTNITLKADGSGEYDCGEILTHTGDVILSIENPHTTEVPQESPTIDADDTEVNLQLFDSDPECGSCKFWQFGHDASGNGEALGHCHVTPNKVSECGETHYCEEFESGKFGDDSIIDGNSVCECGHRKAMHMQASDVGDACNFRAMCKCEKFVEA